MSLTAREIFFKEFGGSKNFMTPDPIKYGKISPNIAYELSKGTGFRNDIIYGVTVVAYVNGKTKRFAGIKIEDKEISKCCHSMHEVENHIGWLKDLGEDILLAAINDDAEE